MFASDRAALSENGDTPAGDVVELSATIENRLPPGRYTIAFDIFTGDDTPAGPTKMARLEITGEKRGGSMLLDHEIEVSTSPERRPRRRPGS